MKLETRIRVLVKAFVKSQKYRDQIGSREYDNICAEMEKLKEEDLDRWQLMIEELAVQI